MAISSDKGRHRRGRWWRRGSYLFSRRTEAPPEAERSFWSARRGNRTREVDARPPGMGDTAEPERSRHAGKDQRPERSRRPEKDRDKDRPRRWEGRERLSAAVVEEPRYTWHDFELLDALPRAQPNRPDAPPMGDGLRHCGKLERILHRQWDARLGPPPPEVVRAVESLARLPDRLKEKLAAGLEGIYVGPGGVPDLDDMGYLRGAPLPSGRATWDICAGAYGERKIVVGDRPSPTPDVMMHEVGHAIDDIDSAFGEWVSDSPDFAALFERVEPLLVSAFHRQGGGLGRKEFFADAFAAIAARQRPALVDMLGGNTRLALDVMLFFNRRYGI
ncbi:hypothetical protein AB0K05_34075 [Nonomuraea sp. NPDC049486]|uniref:Lysine-specific metallo-endopeptidase domain-containing protein n=1 Tax=Nonomuraea harbinensis TaxID=1286938 RepID=A0ABW1C3T1_9ACTN|nr:MULTISPECIES: hypothetical protein [Nonomuraea]TXK35376.1 hypothetical protein FR742_39795 [Nonomuraea sp. C10]